jgi:uncharacterized membrane protein YjfL (UPF0719 family)
MDAILHTLERLLTILPTLAAGVVILYLGKLLFAWTVPYKFQEQLIHKDNPAFGVAFLGYMVGLAIAISGSLLVRGNVLDDLTDLAVGGAVSIVLMRLSIFINHRLILYKFNVDKELIEDRNVGTAFVVAGSSLATGLLLNGVMQGDSSPMLGVPLLGAVRDMVVYWLLGQAILVAGGLVFNRLAGYDVQKEIGTDHNLPAGINCGGLLVALGIIIRASLIGADSNLLVESAITFISAAAGILLLVLIQVIVSHLFFSKSPFAHEVVKDKNPAAGAISAACAIGVAILLAAALAYHPAQQIVLPPPSAAAQGTAGGK